MDASHVATTRVSAGRGPRGRAARSTLANLLQSPQQPQALRSRQLGFGVLLLVLLAIALLASRSFAFSAGHTLVTLVLIAAGAVLVRERMRAAAARRELSSLDFHLPLVMEEIVMSVQAGLDIVPAVERVVRNAEQSAVAPNPVVRALREILNACEHGQSFRAALEATRKKQSSTAFSHALLHLSVAHSDGGNLVDVLRELAEATQRNFEESMEEMLATMPARAIVPLMLTFAGLVIFFLAVPLVQVIESLRKSMPH